MPTGYKKDCAPIADLAKVAGICVTGGGGAQWPTPGRGLQSARKTPPPPTEGYADRTQV